MLQKVDVNIDVINNFKQHLDTLVKELRFKFHEFCELETFITFFNPFITTDENIVSHFQISNKEYMQLVIIHLKKTI